MRHFNRLLHLGSSAFDKCLGAKLQLRSNLQYSSYSSYPYSSYPYSSSSSSSFRLMLNSSRSFSSNSNAAAVNSRRSSLAERMGKISASDTSNTSISGNKIISNNSSSSSSSSSSSGKGSIKAPVVAKYNESYLKTWLGNDMPGQSYLQQMVAASKMKIQAAREASAGNDEKIENPMKELIRMREQSGEHANIEALDTPTFSSQAHMQMQQQAQQASSSYQYNNSSSSTLGRAMYEFTSLAIDLTQTWESASKEISIELPKNNNNESVILEIVSPDATEIGNNLLESREIFLVKIIDLVLSKGYKILGINGLPMNLREAVLRKGIQIISSSSLAKFDVNISSQDNQQENKEEKQGEHEVEEPQSIVGLVSKFYQGTVRSGQQVYAQQTGLVILGGVNDGGEVLADGDIHVYGALSGRVIAGLGSADAKDSKIFIRQFRPSLIGIGDAFIIPDDHPELKRFKDKSVIVSLHCESTARNNNAPVFDGSCVKVGCEDGNFLIFTPL